jgi:hypothetical protein
MPLKVELCETENSLITYAQIIRTNDNDKPIAFNDQHQALQAYDVFKQSDTGKLFFRDHQLCSFIICSELSSGLIRNGKQFIDITRPKFYNANDFYENQGDQGHTIIYTIYKTKIR